MGGSIQVHRLLYEAPLPLNSNGQLSGKYGRVTSYVGGGTYYFTFYLLCYILCFTAYPPQLGNSGSRELPQSEASATLSSSFSKKLEVDTQSEHFDTRVSDMKGVFCFCVLPCGWFLESHPGIWFRGSWARFPFLFCLQHRNSSQKEKLNQNGSWMVVETDFCLFLRRFQEHC